MNQLENVHRSIASSPGQTMAEYALILATVAAVCVALINSSGVIVTGLVAKVTQLL
jgi:Flp pilus assembly pilin Flp